ncbi:hypothetical protein WICPIJ_007153 [Wickerhamomyces pijperi]|uniref:Uncharacterized protein n=1 Tax=Wickerhamomyces pijperi TaxID=599730 RepID=A0A9P8Q108_WICPI|nr:hypothetical protein WICPIJ_007153 [Wickerhamomyces pijperi]
MYHYQGSYGLPYQMYPQPGGAALGAQLSSSNYSKSTRGQVQGALNKHADSVPRTFGTSINPNHARDLHEDSTTPEKSAAESPETPYNSISQLQIQLLQQQMLSTPQMLDPHMNYTHMIPQYMIPSQFQSPQMVFPASNMRTSSGRMLQSATSSLPSTSMATGSIQTGGVGTGAGTGSGPCSNAFARQSVGGGFIQTPPLFMHPQFPYYFHALGYPMNLPMPFALDQLQNQTQHQAENSQEKFNSTPVGGTPASDGENYKQQSTPQFQWNALPSNLRDHPGFTPYRNVGGSDHDFLALSRGNMLYSQMTPGSNFPLNMPMPKNVKTPSVPIYRNKSTTEKNLVAQSSKENLLPEEENEPTKERSVLKSSPMKPNSIIYTTSGPVLKQKTPSATQDPSAVRHAITPEPPKINLPKPTKQTKPSQTIKHSSLEDLQLDFDPYALSHTKTPEGKSTGFLPFDINEVMNTSPQPPSTEKPEAEALPPVRRSRRSNSRHPLSNVITASKELNNTTDSASTPAVSSCSSEPTVSRKRSRRTKKEMEELRHAGLIQTNRPASTTTTDTATTPTASTRSTTRATTTAAATTTSSEPGNQRKKAKFRNKYEMIDLTATKSSGESDKSSDPNLVTPEVQKFPCPYSCVTLSTRDSWRKHLRHTHFQQSITEKALLGMKSDIKLTYMTGGVCLECRERVNSCYDYYNKHIFSCEKTNSAEYLSLMKTEEPKKTGNNDHDHCYQNSFNESGSVEFTGDSTNEELTGSTTTTSDNLAATDVEGS